MKVEPYVFFDGRCDEAIEFYKKALGAKVNMLMRYKDSPDLNSAMIPPGGENKVMHSNVSIGDSQVMMSDGHCGGTPKFDGFTLSITGSSDAEVERIFKALSEGGAVNMPLTKTFFSSKFGMVNDKFGVSWMVLVAQ